MYACSGKKPCRVECAYTVTNKQGKHRAILEKAFHIRNDEFDVKVTVTKHLVVRNNEIPCTGIGKVLSA